MQTRHTKHQTIRQQYVQFKSEVNQLGVAKEQHVNQLLYGRIWSEKISTEVLHSLWHYEGRGGGGVMERPLTNVLNKIVGSQNRWEYDSTH